MSSWKWRAWLVPLVSATLLIGCAAQAPAPEPVVETPSEAAVPTVDPKAAAAFEGALAAMRAGDDAQAEKLLLQMAQEFPALSGPQANLGIIYFRAGDREKAEAAFLRALEINPKNAICLDYLGVISRDKGRFKEAEAYYQQALKIDPDYAYAHRNYGILLELYLGRLKEALVHYKRYQELTGGDDELVKKWIVDLERRSAVKK